MSKPKLNEPTLPAMPACWSLPLDWREWNRLNRLARDSAARPYDHYCADCMPEYKQAMVEAGRCGYPTVKFIRIIERQNDPKRGVVRDVRTLAVKGVRDDKA